MNASTAARVSRSLGSPVEAIFFEEDLPEQWSDFYRADVEFFDDLGSPGSAANLGLIANDHPLVAALPAQGRQ